MAVIGMVTLAISSRISLFPLNKYLYQKEGKEKSYSVKMSNLYVFTQQKQEKLCQNGHKAVQIWECEISKIVLQKKGLIQREMYQAMIWKSSSHRDRFWWQDEVHQDLLPLWRWGGYFLSGCHLYVPFCNRWEAFPNRCTHYSYSYSSWLAEHNFVP